MNITSKGWLPAGAGPLSGAWQGRAAAPCLTVLCFEPLAGLGTQGGEAQQQHSQIPPLWAYN